MNKPRVLLSAVMLLLVAATHAIADDQPTVNVMEDQIVVANGGHKLAIYRKNARLKLQTPYTSYEFKTSIIHNNAWIEPGQSASKPRITKGDGLARIELVFPVAGEREFTLQVEAYRGLDGVFVTSRLKNLGNPRNEYYFWSWDGGFDHYFVPGQKGPEQRSVDPKNWARFGYNDWVFLPAQGGGLAVFSRGNLGRGPDEENVAFINALPRTQYLVRGQSQDIGFGLVGVKNPDEARSCYSKLDRRNIPALNVASMDIKLPSIDYGKPAPEWARKLKTYSLIPYLPYAPTKWTEDEIREWLTDFDLIVDVPHNKTVIENCHKAGVRVIAYLNFMEMLNSEVQLRDREKGLAYYNVWTTAIGHELVDLKDHPNWICVNEKGEELSSVWAKQNDIPGLFSTCLHQPDLHTAAIAQTRKAMEMGVDGIFIDNAGALDECFGHKIGKHKHADPSKTNTQAYEDLLAKVYKVVKSYGDDKIVMQNSGILPDHWAYSDMQMWESCMYGLGVTHRLNEWEELEYAGRLHAEAIRHGKAPVILNYLWDQPAECRKERALLTYAYARFYDFAWSDRYTMMGKEEDKKSARELYRVDLGDAIGGVEKRGSVYYRSFKNGIVIVNPDNSAKTVSIPVRGHGELADVCYDRTVTARYGALRIDLAPESGRVLLWK